MGMGDVLPFARGTYQSGTGLLGEEYWDSVNRQKVKVVKNTDSAALTYKRVAVWEDGDAYEVDYGVSSTEGTLVAGVVDPLLGSSKTVPVNSDFYVVIEGFVTLQLGSGATTCSAGGLIILDDAGSGTVAGAEGATGALTLELNQLQRSFAVALASAGGVAVPGTVAAKLCIRK